MDLDKIKEYLQTYLDKVITPNINNELVGEKDEPITLTVYAVKKGRKGSSQSPIFHIFIDIDPNWQVYIPNKIKKNVEDFMKIFSINNETIIHFNKRPLF